MNVTRINVEFGALMHRLVFPSSVSFSLSLSFFFKGETGIGKSTLMNTLFNTTFENEEASHYESDVQLRPQTYDLQESNVNLKLTIVHTVGFGDQINKEERYRFLHVCLSFSQTECCVGWKKKDKKWKKLKKK